MRRRSGRKSKKCLRVAKFFRPPSGAQLHSRRFSSGSKMLVLRCCFCFVFTFVDPWRLCVGGRRHDNLTVFDSTSKTFKCVGDIEESCIESLL